MRCRLAIAAEQCVDAERALEPQEALRSLLRGRSPYGTAASSTLAPFSDSCSSVPADVHGSPSISDVCSAQVSNYLEGFASKMLRPALEVKAMDEAMGAAGVYTDPIWSMTLRSGRS